MGSTLALPAVTAAVRALLVADPQLTALLATAPAAVGGGPAIYTDGAVPEDSDYPLLAIGGGSEASSNTMGPENSLKWGSSVSLQVKCMSVVPNNDEGYSVIGRVKAVLYEGRTLTVNGYGSASVTNANLPQVFYERVGGILIRHFPFLVYVTVHQS